MEHTRFWLQTHWLRAVHYSILYLKNLTHQSDQYLVVMNNLLQQKTDYLTNKFFIQFQIFCLTGIFSRDYTRLG